MGMDIGSPDILQAEAFQLLCIKPWFIDFHRWLTGNIQARGRPMELMSPERRPGRPKKAGGYGSRFHVAQTVQAGSHHRFRRDDPTHFPAAAIPVHQRPAQVHEAAAFSINTSPPFGKSGDIHF